MQIYENIQHPMDIYDEIFILWHTIFLNISIHWHLEFRYSIELFLMCHYYITRSFARSFTFFIIFEKNAFFNVLYSYFWRSLHLCIILILLNMAIFCWIIKDIWRKLFLLEKVQYLFETNIVWYFQTQTRTPYKMDWQCNNQRIIQTIVSSMP